MSKNGTDEPRVPENGKTAEDQLEDVREEIEERVNDIKREVRTRAEDAKRDAAKQLNAVAARIRKEVREDDSKAEDIERADELARNLEKAAYYLNTRSLNEMGQEATQVVTRNPWRNLMVALIVGFILGLIVRGGGDK